MTPWNPTQHRDVYRLQIERAVEYIHENLQREIRLQEVAAAASMSAFHFHRIFSSITGETINDFANRLRLERAANWLIKNPAMNITAIAFSCGFNSQAAFARSFKQHFGVTAGAYRRDRTGQFRQMALHPAAAPHSSTGEDVSRFLSQIQIRQLPELHLATVANLEGYSLARICAAWNRLAGWASSRGLLNHEARMIGLSLDDPFITPKSRCRYYACIQVPELPAPTEPVGAMTLPGGRYAVCQVACMAEEIAQVYHALYGVWLPESGCLPADAPTYEVYLKTPETHSEGKFEMEVCLPLI